MVKISKKGRAAAGGSGRGASNGRGGGGGRGLKTLNTSKGTFVFQRVTDGLYIEHQWGKNSGHIGIAQESLASFVRTLTELATSSGAIKKSAGAKAQGGGTAAKGKGITKKPKEKKEKVVKMTQDDMDADLDSYIKGR